MYYNQNPMYQQSYYPQQPQPIYHPLTYTNGVVGAKAFFMNPNSIVYLIDSDTNNVLYEKRADAQGRCTLKAFSLSEIPLEQVGMSFEKVNNYATKQDIERLEKILNDNLANLMINLKGGVKQDEQ